MKVLVLFALTVGLVLPAMAQTRTLVNVDKSGVALQGYDPVAFFTDGKPVKGDSRWTSEHDAATYRFASNAHKELFDKNPGRYVPAFGGYCAYGVSRNKLVKIDVDAFQIVDGRLLLQYSRDVLGEFNKDRSGNLDRAEQNWPGLVEKKGK